MDRQNNNAVVLERVFEGKVMLELIKKRKINWLGHWLRRNCLLKVTLQGMVKGRKFAAEDIRWIRQLYEKWTVWKYEKEGWEHGRMEKAQFAVKDLSLGRTLWLIDLFIDWFIDMLQDSMFMCVWKCLYSTGEWGTIQQVSISMYFYDM